MSLLISDVSHITLQIVPTEVAKISNQWQMKGALSSLLKEHNVDRPHVVLFAVGHDIGGEFLPPVLRAEKDAMDEISCGSYDIKLYILLHLFSVHYGLCDMRRHLIRPPNDFLENFSGSDLWRREHSPNSYA